MSEILFQPLGDPIAAGESLEHIADIDPRMTRTHYFDGRLLTAEDLERDQIYLDQRLREIGKVLGHGIINGLDLNFDPFSGLLTLQPGQAMTSLGRVLQLNTQLMVSLGDRALISQLNASQYRKFNRALYAVVLRYVDVATDLAEVFPTDLASKRGADYALVTESVQMGLVPLPVPLVQQNPLQLRASLMREFLGNELADALIPEDSVALGVIAIQNDTPQWLDSQLLRQPLRKEIGAADRQADLSRQYEALLADVFTHRASGSLNNQFAAADYFSLLPPVGTVPKDAVDAVNGHQGYFPEHFNVHIAPIRLSDVELIKAESLLLPNIDLSSTESTDIVVLAPLSNADYGRYGAQLERGYNPINRRLPQMDLLRLKLYPVHPVHALDTDANVWQNIWDTLADGQLLYVRRPVRAAETAVSGIVLALGTTVPEPTPPAPIPPPPTDNTETDTETEPVPVPTPTPTPSDPGSLIESEDNVFLRFVNFKRLAEIRPAEDNLSREALERLMNQHGENARTVQQITEFLLLTDRHYNPVIWPTVQILVERDAMAPLLERLRQVEEHPAAVGKTVLDAASQQGLPNALQGDWERLIERVNS
ncbi:hypothetical protein [Ketobacter alkanivorans]|uniref:Uncharacterized protein n=1 Tax=Ketobacter alkanivorans TaxID=1917421 RepID=A0A2K9LLF1_9GAMM|nr:hypothetical protein [Ketobacter alkanivorans]AUM13112.1 hypothetical protein Kalk_12050 [Ketobacter alkanivorans]